MMVEDPYAPPNAFKFPIAPWLITPKANASLATLKEVELAYLSKYITDKLYHEWVKLNLSEYSMSDDPIMLNLWNLRLDEVVAATPADCEDALILGARMANNSQFNASNLRRLGVLGYYKQKRLLGLDVVSCSNGNTHLKILYGKITKRKQLNFLNEMFPWCTTSDRGHTSLNFRDLVWGILERRNSREGKCNLHAISQVLQTNCIGTLNTIVTAHLIAALGNSEYQRIYDLVRLDRVCCLTNKSYQKYFKAVSVAVRRTGKWVDGTRLSTKSISKLASFELCSGRAHNTSDWKDEMEKRTQKTLPLTEAFTGE